MLNRLPAVRHVLALACAAALGGAPASFAADAPAASATDVARPAVGTLLNQAQVLVTSGQGAQAIAPLQAAEKLAPLNPYESFMLHRLRGAASLQTGDLTQAQTSFEQVLSAQRLTPSDQLDVLASLGKTLYRAKDYAGAAKWLQRYADAKGFDAEVLALRAPALYFAKDYAGAKPLLLNSIQADIEVGRSTPLTTWRMLASSQKQLADEAGYRQSLRQMAVQYPQPALWAEVVERELGDASKLSDRQFLDAQRLLRAAGALRGAEEAMTMAALVQQAGFPGEALQVLDEALAQPNLSADHKAALTQRRTAAAAKADADRKQRPRDEAAARTARDGQGLFTIGWTWVTEGQPATGLPLMNQGLQKGGLNRADEARLHHGMALALAGQSAEARQALQQVKGDPNLVVLASLWADFAGRRVAAATP